MKRFNSRIIGSSLIPQTLKRRRDKRPRIVVVSHICPFPAVHGNRTRFVALLQWLREAGYELTFILQPLDVDDKNGISRLAEAVDRLEVARPYGLASRAVTGVKRG